MKILHVINSLSAGGAEKLVSSLAKEQAKTNTVGVFTFNSATDVFSDFDTTKLNRISTPSNNYFSLTNINALYKTIKKYEIIHVHLFPSLYIVAILSIFLGNKKFIFTEHNTHNRRREKKYLKHLEKIIYSRYKTIICITNSVKEELEKWIGAKPEKVVISNFIDIKEINDKVAYSKEYLGFKKKDIVLVMVGSFSKQKDQITILKALTLLPEDYKLVLVGDGKLRNTLESFTMENRLVNRVKFLGIRKDVYSILKACDYGIQSSNWEGFGIAALEYMACNLVTLGSDVPGLNEVIQVKENLFKRGDANNLVDLIINLNNVKISEYKLIQKRWIEKFDIAFSNQKHIQIYKEL